MPQTPGAQQRISRRLTDEDRRLLADIHRAEPYARDADIIMEGIRLVHARIAAERRR